MNQTGNKNGHAIQRVRCVVYTRKSTEEGLRQEFNSLDAQREAAEAFIASQKSQGWECANVRYDDGGFTGANTDRPALKQLMADIEAGKIDCVVVYKVDRLSRSLLDFAKLMETFEKHRVSFVSVTQHFNTTHSMGRLTLNILLSFAQFEREIISERTRDKIAAARRKGKWSGGHPLLGYDIVTSIAGTKLIFNLEEAERVRVIFDLYLDKQSLIQAAAELNRRGWTTKQWATRIGKQRGGQAFDKTNLFRLLTNITYRGFVRYKEEVHHGEHQAIIDEETFQRVQETLRANGRAGGAHIRTKYHAPLKSVLYCKPCGRAMVHSYSSKPNRRFRYYVCSKAQKNGWKECPSKSIPAEQVERFVIEQIRTIARDPAIRSMVLDQARAQGLEELESLRREITVAERDLVRLQTDIARVALAAQRSDEAADRLADLHEQVSTIEQALASLRNEETTTKNSLVSKAQVDAALEDFTPMWSALSSREQSRIVQLLIKRIDYDGSKGKIAITFQPLGLKTMTNTNISEDRTCLTA